MRRVVLIGGLSGLGVNGMLATDNGSVSCDSAVAFAKDHLHQSVDSIVSAMNPDMTEDEVAKFRAGLSNSIQGKLADAMKVAEIATICAEEAEWERAMEALKKAVGSEMRRADRAFQVSDHVLVFSQLQERRLEGLSKAEFHAQSVSDLKRVRKEAIDQLTIDFESAMKEAKQAQEGLEKIRQETQNKIKQWFRDAMVGLLKRELLLASRSASSAESTQTILNRLHEEFSESVWAGLAGAEEILGELNRRMDTTVPEREREIRTANNVMNAHMDGWLDALVNWSISLEDLEAECSKIEEQSKDSICTALHAIERNECESMISGRLGELRREAVDKFLKTRYDRIVSELKAAIAKTETKEDIHAAMERARSERDKLLAQTGDQLYWSDIDTQTLSELNDLYEQKLDS